MTRLVCIYYKLDPRTKRSLESYAPGAGLETEWVDTKSDWQVYADELEKRWGLGEDLILVEQDKEIFPGQLQALMSCTEPWCGHTYWLYPIPSTELALTGFGFVKFSAAIQEKAPVSAFRGVSPGPLDRRFDDLVSAMGFRCHLHGHVVHHHVYEPQPEWVRRQVEEFRLKGMFPPAAYPEPLGPHLLPGSYDLPGRSHSRSGRSPDPERDHVPD